MNLRMAGLGTALPPHAIQQRDAAEQAARYGAADDGRADRLRRLYDRSTVQQRYSVLLGNPSHGDDEPPVDPQAGANHHTPQTKQANLSPFYPEPAHENDYGPTVSQRMASYRTHALPLVQQAATAALSQAGIAAGDVTQLITVSCTGFAAPGIDVHLIDALGLDDEVGRTMIGFMGCHGAINGLRVAQGLAGPSDNVVLLCAVELCSLHFQYGAAPDQMLANALFADGAAAMVAYPDHGTPLAAAHRPADARNNHANETPTRQRPPRVVATRSKLIPDSRSDMQWHITEHGFEMTLSRRVPTLIESHLRPWLSAWLAEHGLDLADIGGWAIHPGGPQIITATERALGLSEGAGDISRQVLRTCGNMSSPTVLFILERLRAREVPLPWVALGFGPGLIGEAALLR